MKMITIRVLRTSALAALLLAISASAFARHKFDKDFSWHIAWQSLFGTSGWTSAFQATVSDEMSQDNVLERFSDPDTKFISDHFTGPFERFLGYEDVWFYRTPYPVEVTLLPDGGERSPMDGAWLAFQDGRLTFCSRSPPDGNPL